MPGLIDQRQFHGENTSPSAGSGSAVEVDTRQENNDIDCAYDVSSGNSGDIVVEVSMSGEFSGEEWEHTRLSQSDGEVDTGGDLIQINTTYKHVRLYAGSGFSDAEVNELEIVAERTN